MVVEALPADGAPEEGLDPRGRDVLVPDQGHPVAFPQRLHDLVVLAPDRGVCNGKRRKRKTLCGRYFFQEEISFRAQFWGLF